MRHLNQMVVGAEGGSQERPKAILADRLLLRISASALALFGGGSAFAQAAGANADSGGAASGNNEIVVTAQFREQKLQDTPLAITAVDSAMLEARSQSSLSEITAQAPSVTLRSDTSVNGPSIVASIRGLGQGDPSPALEPGVGIYVDDVYFPRLTGANLDLLDVARVEILRGPQGTLTGRNSEGGAIRFVSRELDGASGGYLSATYGSRNRIALRGSVDFTIAENLYGRITGAFADQEGYVSQIDYGCANPGGGVVATRPAGDCTISKWGDVGYRAVKGMLRWNPSEMFDLTISADYVRDQRNAPAEVLLFGFNPDPNTATSGGIPFDNRFVCGKFCNYASNGQSAGTYTSPFVPGLQYPLEGSSVDNRINYKAGGVSGNLKVRLSDTMQLTSITAYRDFTTSYTSDIDLSPANVASNRNDYRTKFWSQELRLNAELGEMADLTLGGYYSNEKTDVFSKQDLRNAGLQFVAKDKVRLTSKAVFGTVIFRLTDALTLTGGVRYTSEAKDFTYSRLNFDGVTVNQVADPGGFLTGKTVPFRGNRWDYRISADYRFSPELLVYGTISTGFKGGGVNPRPFVAAQAVPFGAERLTAFELGFKSDLFDRKVRLNVSAYYNKFSDAQIQLSSCPQYNPPGAFFVPCALPANAGSADIKGIEAELFVRPVEGLQIDASGSLLDWDWKCLNPQVLGLPAAASCSSDPALLDRLFSPPGGIVKHQWSIGAQYEFELGNAGTLTPRIDVAYQGGLSGNVKPAAGSPSAILGGVDAYTLANARLTWRNAAKDLDISLEVTNLFDKYYNPYKFDGIAFFYGNINAAVGRPREWAVSVKKKF